MSPPAAEPSFQFGRNWSYFLRHVDRPIIERARQSLQRALGVDDLRQRTFLDVGSGSGLFSLAAWELGAEVTSFDVDPQSVQCTTSLREQFAGADRWRIEQASILDPDAGYPAHDIVYSWGVLHHTGDLWNALEAACRLVKPGGQLLVAIYNDQGATSRRWTRIKRLYNRLPAALRFLVLGPALLRIWGPTVLRDALRGRPLKSWRAYGQERGMHPWWDLVDWVGGYPFEVARPEEVFQFCRQRGFQLTYLTTCGAGRGCNEFGFRSCAIST